MNFTVFFKPSTKIFGAIEQSSTFSSAVDALKEAEGLIRSDERVRILDQDGRGIELSALRMLAEREREERDE